MFKPSSFYLTVLGNVSSSKSLVVIRKPSESPNQIAVIGSQLGDEGKGRIIDNKISQLQTSSDEFYVIRSQGGSNAGHTVQLGDIKLGLHQIPSAVFHDNAISILDFGMVIHPEDLLAEIHMVEKVTNSLKGRLFLSSEAMFCTDVERAKEVLNRILSGKAKGGTGRGISPTTSQRYEKLGLEISDLVCEDWAKKLTKHYNYNEKLFASQGEDLSTYEVPDFKSSKETGSSVTRNVGNLEEFLKRLKAVRAEFIERDLVKDTFFIDQQIYIENKPVFFEMAQAIGLSPSFGTRPDVTSTETSAYGITLNTRVFKFTEIEDRIGVMKATYMSSVGARKMPTEADNEWSNWVREFAHEYGTTTGRPRDICYLDLPFMRYNTQIGQINQLGMTHLDVSREDMKIKVCIGYELDGQEVFYKPDLEYLSKVEPIIIQLDGWDSEECAKAKNFSELPENAKRFVHFVESALEIPATIITTGPDRENLILR